MIINNVIDLATYLGMESKTREAVAHAVLNGTKCGAWIKFDVCMVTGTHTERRHFVLHPDQERVWVQSTKQGGKWNEGRDEWTDPVNLPSEFVDFLYLEEENGRHYLADVSWETVVDAAQRYNNVKLHNTVLTVWLDVQDHGAGIAVGSIVEGAEQDAETFELSFPFTGEQFSRALDAVENSAQELWNETHGCTDGECWEDPETGYFVINPECPNCGGEGIVL